ncbi:hypothetical protein N9O24_01045, partial [bacterium]|nr:hypothetical protein [bacterium]
RVMLIILVVHRLLHTQVASVQTLMPFAKVVVIDSDSSDATFLRGLPDDVDVCYAKNTGYEYGAYKYALRYYTEYDYYVCLQDSLLLRKAPCCQKSYTYHYKVRCGYPKYLELYDSMLRLLEGTCFRDYFISLLASRSAILNMSVHNSWILSGQTLTKLYEDLSFECKSKIDAQCTERIVGAWLGFHRQNTANLHGIVSKVHGGRL